MGKGKWGGPVRKGVLGLGMAIGSLALLSSAVSCSAKDEPTPETIHIGFLTHFEDTSMTQTRVAQILVALRAINEAGGVELDDGRHQLDLIAEDHEGTPAGTIEAMKRLKARGVSAAIDPPWSSLMLGSEADYSDGAAFAAKEIGMVLVSGSATATAITDLDDDGFVFRTCPSDLVQASVAARHLAETLGASTVSILYRGDPWGIGLSQAFTSEFEALGGQVLASSVYDSEQDLDSYDFKEELDAIFAGRPEAVYLANFGEFFPIANQIVAGGYLDAYEGQGPIFFGTDGIFPEDVITNVPEEILRSLTGTISASDHDTPDYQKLEGLMGKAGLADTDIDTIRYDAAYLIALAIQAAGSTDPDQIKEHLVDVSRKDDGDVEIRLDQWETARDVLLSGGTVNYEGPSGPIEFSEQGDPTVGTIAIWAVEENGEGGYRVNSDQVVPYSLAP